MLDPDGVRHKEEACTESSLRWQRHRAWLCSYPESQRPPSRSLRRPSSTLGPSTDRAASAASPGRALHLGRSRRVTQPQPKDSTTRRSSPTLSLLLASLLGSAINRCVCRTHVGRVSSSTRRIPAQEPLQVGEERVNKVFIAEFSFMSKTPAYQPGLFLSVSPDSGEGSRMSWVGLAGHRRTVFRSASTIPLTSMASSSSHPGPLLDRTQSTHDQVLDQGQPGPGQRPGANLCRRS